MAVPRGASLCSPVCSSPKRRLQRFSQQRGRQSSLENVLVINDSGSCAENASANLTPRGVVFVDGWVGEWLALILMSTPALCLRGFDCVDVGCALPHRGHYPVLVSAGLHLGGQRDSDVSARREAADGWTPTSLSRWVTLSLVYVVLTRLLNYGLLEQRLGGGSTFNTSHADWCVPDLWKYGCLND